MNNEEMVTIEACVDLQPEELKTERVKSFAKLVNSTPNTVYKWLRDGNMYAQFLDNGDDKNIAVYRMVNFVEQESKAISDGDNHLQQDLLKG